MNKITNKNSLMTLSSFLKCILLASLILSFTACSKIVEKEKKIILNNESQKYVSISSTRDFVIPGKSEIVIYDASMKKLNTQSINTGGYFNYIEREDSIYFIGGMSILRLDKKSGAVKEFPNIVDDGIIDKVNVQGDTPLLVKNIRAISDNEYDCEICEFSDLDNPKIITSFKTNKSLAMDAIKLNNKYYVLSRLFGVEEYSNYALEIYDDNYALISKQILDSPCTFFQFYENNDSLYIVGDSFGLENDILKLNEDDSLTSLDINGFVGCIFINQFEEELYVFDNTGVVNKVNIEEKNVTPVIDMKKIDESYDANNDYYIRQYFTENSKAFSTVIRNSVKPDLPAKVKHFIKTEQDQEFKEIEGLSVDNDVMMGIYFGALE